MREEEWWAEEWWVAGEPLWEEYCLALGRGELLGMAVESTVEMAVGIAVATVDIVTRLDLAWLGDLERLLARDWEWDPRERDGLRLSRWERGLRLLAPRCELWLCREREGEMVGLPEGSRSSSGSGGRRSGSSMSFRVRLGQMGFWLFRVEVDITVAGAHGDRLGLACGKALDGRLAGSEAVPPLLLCWLLIAEWCELREADRE